MVLIKIALPLQPILYAGVEHSESHGSEEKKNETDPLAKKTDLIFYTNLVTIGNQFAFKTSLNTSSFNKSLPKPVCSIYSPPPESIS
ncbi:MAG: hypothetical protein V4687_00535 [Bacteroidota bacterium]